MTNDWPELNYEALRETLVTLQLWSQIVGKVRLALTPWLDHSWHVPLYINARGVGTSAIPYGAEVFEIDFDLARVHRRRTALTDSTPLVAERCWRAAFPDD